MPQPPCPAGAGGSAVANAEMMLTIVPSPRSSIGGTTSFASTNWATTLASSLVSSSATDRSRKWSMLPAPVCTALFTSTSMWPHSSSTRATPRSSDGRSRRSMVTSRARRPDCSISSAVASRLPGMTRPPCSSSRASPSRRVRAATATSKPAAASCTAVALPMPRLAPVTRATLGSTGASV